MRGNLILITQGYSRNGKTRVAPFLFGHIFYCSGTSQTHFFDYNYGMKVLDFTKVAIKYKNMWVAFAGPQSTKVVGHGKKLKTALERALKNGYTQPTISHMPKDVNASYVGGFRIE